MSRKPAFTIREGSSAVNVYKYGKPAFGESKKSDRRARYCLAWYRHAADDLQRETKTGEVAARARAREIAIALANNRPEVIELAGAELETYSRIRAIAQSVGTPLFDLVQQAADAKKQLGSASLMDAVASHLQTRTIDGSRATMRMLITEFMRRKRTAMLNKDRSEVHIKNLGHILEGLVVPAFGDREIQSIDTDEWQDWLNDRRDKKGRIVGPRRRRHIRAAIVAVYNDARKNRHLPHNQRHAAEAIDCPKIIKGKEPTFTPEQFELLINSAHGDRWQSKLVPIFAFGGLGRMRNSEICRLDWTAVHLFDKERPGLYHPIAGEIDVSPEVAGKTGMARIIEITPSLAKFLRLYARPSGPVIDPNIKRIDNHMRRFAERIGLTWKGNILRGSSTSYLYTFTNDLKYVAAQHGTSERELKREYLERKTREDAIRYLTTSPTDSQRIFHGIFTPSRRTA